MVSIPKPVPKLQQRSSSVNSQTDSNGSWDLSISNLSDSLSQICSSPTQQSPGYTFSDYMKNRTPSSSIDFSGHSRSSPPAAALSVSPPVDKLSQAVFLQANRKCKRVRVRHEESNRKLQQQLAAICGGSSVSKYQQSNGISTRGGASTNTAAKRPPHRPDIKRESMKRALRIKLDLADVAPEQLSVQFADGLSVYSCSNDAHERIASEETPFDVNVETVMCLVDEGALYIKQYPQKYMSMEFPRTVPPPPLYLPIMQQDDASGTWRMVLHVPGCYDKTGISVKTVDDKLFLSWCAELGATTCKLSMDLPYNVNSRSVSGAVSEDNQLILEALLGRRRDRCLTL